jgi:peptidoglycan/LPS O-acetylase OafA/YrhL
MDQKRTFVTLDGLRGIAAIAVLFRHTVPNFMPTSPSASGYLAVDLFFVLSGFVIAYAYERALLNGMTIAQFMVKRVVRLYPLYIVAGLVSLLFLTIRLFVKHQGMSEEIVYFANLFYIPIPINLNTELHLYPLNDPAWSLGLEILINAVFAAIIVPLQRPIVWPSG